HRKRFYLTKADLARCCDGLLVRVLELRVSPVPRPIRNASVLKEVVIFKPKNAGTYDLITVGVPTGGIIIVIDRGRPRARPRITRAIAGSELAGGKHNWVSCVRTRPIVDT